MFFQTHTLALRAEFLKLKRSGIYWICLGAALFIPLLITIVFLVIKNTDRGNENQWDQLIQTSFGAFTSFFFPVFLVLIVVRLVYVEHRSDTWKLMETQPVSRAALYLAKWEIALLLSFACLALLLLFSIAGGLLIQAFRPDYKLGDDSITWSKALGALVRIWVSGLGIISIQYLLALVIRSFAWPMIIGVMATIIGSMFIGFGVVNWWPYAAPALSMNAYDGSISGGFLLFHEKLSILFSLFFLWLGLQIFTGKSLKRAYFGTLPASIATVVIVLAFGGLFAWITAPSEIPQHYRTVIAGTIRSAKPLKAITLLRYPIGDTVALIPVANGTFHTVIGTELPAGMYFLRAGTVRQEIYMGAKDSLFIEVEVDDKRPGAKVRGTRLAENLFLSKGINAASSWMLEDMAYNYQPDEYVSSCLSEWSDRIKEIRSFKTAENIRPSAAFLKAQEKLATAYYTYLLDVYYPDIFRVYHPNETLNYPTSVNRVRSKVGMDEKELASFTSYRDFVSSKLRQEAGRDKQKLLRSLGQLKEPAIRDMVVFDVVQSDVLTIRDSGLRQSFFDQTLALTTDAGIRTALVRKNQRLKSLQPNSTAPPFSAEAMNAAAFDLSKFAGRYVVIDVWASWCGPCKREAPFFEQLAETYTSEDVAFVGLSVDENINAWKSDVAGNRSRVLQLWVHKADADFSRDYAVNTIPRYILLSPKGTILNADMPPPSDPEFERILQKEIPSLGGRIL